MTFRIPLVCTLCFVTLFAFASVWAEEEPKSPVLSEATTMMEIFAYLNYESEKLVHIPPSERTVAFAPFLFAAGERLLEIATDPRETRQGHSLKFSAITGQLQAGVEGAEQQLETFLNELAARDAELAEPFQFSALMFKTRIHGFAQTEQRIEAFLKELEAKEQTPERVRRLFGGQFVLFAERAKIAEATPANFNRFMSELKGWTYGRHAPFVAVASLGFEIAHRNNVPAERVVRELTEFIQSPQCTLPEEGKKELIAELEKMLRLAPGADPKLFGKTIDNEEFKWEDLREKYVLIKFTATWCGPCKAQIPGMREAYEKYKDKGLEIVSVYMAEHTPDPVATVKAAVEEEKITWIVLSEALTARAGQPIFGQFYAIPGFPTFVLTNKEGKIIMPASHGDEWKAKLAEIFE